MNEYSVLMSVYNKENPEYLKQSIQSMLEQTAVTNNFVIICDGPLTEALDAVLADYENKIPKLFTIVRLPQNKGLGAALNEGIKHCKNELIARMDSDDISCSDRCALQLEIFGRPESVDIVSGTIRESNENMEYTGILKKLPRNHNELLIYAKRRCPFNHPCVMYKKSAVLDAGGYQPFYLFEDYHLWVRMLTNGSIGYNIELPLLDMRAGSSMYKRRGGLKYLQSSIRLRYWMKKIGFIGLTDLIFCVLGQGIVCLLPNSLRRGIYKRFLRS